MLDGLFILLVLSVVMAVAYVSLCGCDWNYLLTGAL